MIFRAFKFRLDPTPEQDEMFGQCAGVTRLIYNLALEQRRDWWRQRNRIDGRGFTFADQSKEVTALRAEFDWIRAVHSTPPQQALRDLDLAFKRYFSGQGGFPKPRRKGENDSFRFMAANVSAPKILSRRWAALRIPKVGWVRYRRTREMRGEVRQVTITRTPLGWHVVFLNAINEPASQRLPDAVGIDRGVANTLALSTGELVTTTCTSALEAKKRRAQRILAKRRRGSVRYRKQRQRLASISAKIARVRADWRHKATRSIACRFGTVALEKLSTTKMTASGGGARKRGLNRSILEQGWYAFERDLAYKLAERGGQIAFVNPAYTSQECSSCGTVDKQSRKNQASFVCTGCGSEMHADTNAALNILRRGTASMLVEDSGSRADEARTFNHAALAA